MNKEQFKNELIEIYDQFKLIGSLLIFDSNKAGTVEDSNRMRKNADKIHQELRGFFKLIETLKEPEPEEKELESRFCPKCHKILS